MIESVVTLELDENGDITVMTRHYDEYMNFKYPFGDPVGDVIGNLVADIIDELDEVHSIDIQQSLFVED